MSPMTKRYDHQVHGYRSGHQLLAGSISLERHDQDVVDRLSDLAGQLRPSESFSPYLTGYPLPSKSFYVFARTWQDLEAPRAGCVVTRSLFVPMKEWIALSDVDELLPSLSKPWQEPGQNIYSPVNELPVGPEARVYDPRRFELVEALFLEARQAIVMFDCDEAEAITARLLTALWPKLRGSFAFGTFALAPRTIAGRSFDLLFAPSNARSRFMDWTGRRIEASKVVNPTSRHRWTDEIANRIFESPQPRLLTGDAFGIFDEDDVLDENSFRLSLRWNELVKNARESPIAALGLIDIFNSHAKVPLDGSVPVYSLLQSAVHRATTELDTPQAWTFLTALMTKFKDQSAPPKIRKQIRRAAEMLAFRDAAGALDFLTSKSPTQVHPLIVTCIGNGLADAVVAKQYAVSNLERLSSEVVTTLLVASRRLAKGYLTAATENAHGIVSIPELEWICDSLPVRERRRLLKGFAPALTQREHAKLLDSLVRNMTVKDVASSITVIGRVNSFVVSAFDPIFVALVKSEVDADLLRTSIMRGSESSGADRFLASTLDVSAEGLEWLLHAPLMPVVRRSHILSSMLSPLRPSQLASLARDSLRRKKTLSLLEAGLPRTSLDMASILAASDSINSDEIQIGLSVINTLDVEQKHDLAFKLLVAGLSHEQLDTWTLDLVKLVPTVITVDELIFAAVAQNSSGRVLSRNLSMLASLPAPTKKSILLNIDALSSRIVQKSHTALDESAYVSMGRMITEAVDINRSKAEHASLTLLPFAIRWTRYPCSPLLTRIFPLAYRVVKEQSAKAIFFDDAKTLRRDLVYAYQSSSWPPADLMICALGAGIGSEVVNELRKRWHGDEYIQAIENDLSRLPKSFQADVLRCLHPGKRSKKS